MRVSAVRPTSHLPRVKLLQEGGRRKILIYFSGETPEWVTNKQCLQALSHELVAKLHGVKEEHVEVAGRRKGECTLLLCITLDPSIDGRRAFCLEREQVPAALRLAVSHIESSFVQSNAEPSPPPHLVLV